MKKLKVISLFGLLFLLCGCNVTYNLDIVSNQTFEETVILYESEDDPQYKETFKNMLANKIVANFSDRQGGDHGYDESKYNIAYYDMEAYSLNNNYGIKYHYKRNQSRFSDSNALRTCTNKIDFSTTNNMIKIELGEFKCFSNYPELDHLTINLIVDKTVLYSNADYINGNKYSWIIDRVNYLDKTVSINYKIDNNQNMVGGTERKAGNLNDEESNNKEQPRVVEEDPSIVLPIPESSHEEEESQLENIQNVANQYQWLIILGSFGVFGILIFIVIKLKKRV